MAQTESDGKAGKALETERHAINRTEEDRARADREDFQPTATGEWLSEPPGVDSRVAGISAASSTSSQGQCGAEHVSAIDDCHDEWQRCFGTSFSVWRFLRCSTEAIACLEDADAAYQDCLEEAG